MIFDKVKQTIKDNRQARIDGKHISIPFEDFPSISKAIPGIMKGRYTIVTAGTKVGKTQLADALFLYNPINFLQNHPETDIKVKIIYFTLEMSREDKIFQCLSNRIYQDTKKVISPEELQSVFSDNILTKENEDLVESYTSWFEFFESHVTFIDHIRNPTGMYKYCREVAREHGTFYKDGKLVEIPEKADWSKPEYSYDTYVPNSANEYFIVIVDHCSLLTVENTGQDVPGLYGAIKKLSSDYFLRLRDTFKFSPVLIQQQTADSEKQQFTFKGQSIVEKLKPSKDGLADYKATANDCDSIYGLWNPERYNLKTYEGWNIEKWGDNYREFSVIFNRRGRTNLTKDLYFNGACNYFEELNNPESFIKNPDLYKNYIIF